MKFEEFHRLNLKNRIFTMQSMELLGYDRETLRRQIQNWIKQGYVIQLKKGLYAYLGLEKNKLFSNFYVASLLYGDNSYISLESAMSFYELIPERVFQVSLVSTSKTKTFINDLTSFNYKHIKPNLFDYFINQIDEFGAVYKIAYPEKALLDYIYFKVKANQNINEDFFEENLRLQNIEILKISRLKELEELFNMKKISYAIAVLERILKNA
jgi:predicted transcriptional regulator of viral defense system